MPRIEPNILQGFVYCALMAATLLLSSCATKQWSGPPPGIDLSGSWQLDASASDEVILHPKLQRLGRAGTTGTSQPHIGRGGEQRKARQSAPALPPSGSTSRLDRPAVMTATEMTIEQVSDSLGIAFPGEVLRDINWGETERHGETVTAGWVNNSLLILSNTRHLKMAETYSIDTTGTILTIEIKPGGNKGKKTFTRVFRRIDLKQ